VVARNSLQHWISVVLISVSVLQRKQQGAHILLVDGIIDVVPVHCYPR
jgi:hypothetical protein